VTLVVDNTFTGGTTIVDGTVMVASNTALGTGTVISGQRHAGSDTTLTLDNAVIIDGNATLAAHQRHHPRRHRYGTGSLTEGHGDGDSVRAKHLHRRTTIVDGTVMMAATRAGHRT